MPLLFSYGTLQQEAARRDALVDALADDGAGWLRAAPAGAGMHLVAWLAPGAGDDAAASRAAHGAGIEALPPVLILGFGATPEARMRQAVRRLVDALRRRDAA